MGPSLLACCALAAAAAQLLPSALPAAQPPPRPGTGTALLVLRLRGEGYCITAAPLPPGACGVPLQLSAPLPLPLAPAADASNADSADTACGVRAAAELGLKSAPLELLLRPPEAAAATASPPRLLGLLAPSDASSRYSRESSVMVRMCFGTGGQRQPG
jgi:hypothetical protein